eukprot:COSAG01_NODE_1623_length_9708_cov_32.044438_7_plen_54_part_00
MRHAMHYLRVRRGISSNLVTGPYYAQIVIYNGDADACVPYNGMRLWYTAVCHV